MRDKIIFISENIKYKNNSKYITHDKKYSYKN